MPSGAKYLCPGKQPVPDSEAISSIPELAPAAPRRCSSPREPAAGHTARPDAPHQDRFPTGGSDENSAQGVYTEAETGLSDRIVGEFLLVTEGFLFFSSMYFLVLFFFSC